MRGYLLEIRNDLLEPKHFERMGKAVWLYMWLLDKVTSVNENGIGKVLGNSLVTHKEVAADLPIAEHTFRRWINQLEAGGYIKTLNTPHGRTIMILKTHKRFGKRYSYNTKLELEQGDKNGEAGTNQPSQKSRSSLAKNVGGGDKNGEAIYRRQYTKDNKQLDTLAKASADKPQFGDPKINAMMDFWEAQTEMPIKNRMKLNRRACSILMGMYGEEKLKQLIRGVAMAMDDRYAPTITDFSQLKDRAPELIVWGRKRTKEQRSTII